MEKECEGYTQIATADFLHWSVSTGNIWNSHLGRGCLEADVRHLKKRLKWPSSRLVLVMPCWNAMSLKSSFTWIAFLVSHSKTYSGNRIPLLFYCAHERNRKEVGAFWSFKTSFQALYSLLKTLWIFFLTHSSGSHCVQCINSALVLHFLCRLVEMSTFLREPFVLGAPSSSLATACPVGRGNWSRT